MPTRRIEKFPYTTTSSEDDDDHYVDLEPSQKTNTSLNNDKKILMGLLAANVDNPVLEPQRDELFASILRLNSNTPKSRKLQNSKVDAFGPQLSESDEDEEDAITPEFRKRAVDRQLASPFILTPTTDNTATPSIQTTAQFMQNNYVLNRSASGIDRWKITDQVNNNMTGFIVPTPTKKSPNTSLTRTASIRRPAVSMRKANNTNMVISNPLISKKSHFHTFSSRDELNMKLRDVLLKQCPSESGYLSRIIVPVRKAEDISSPDAIGVFVDFSNIYIGFMAEVKLKLNNSTKHLDHRFQSFDMENFIAILQRGRPTSMRFLSSSQGRGKDSPMNDCFDVAKNAFDYNVVIKARLPPVELSEHPNSTPQGRGSSRPRLKESHVDEAVQSAIRGYLLDANDGETGTIVLATGDGAASSFDEGFPQTIMYALKKDWKVELVCWKRSLSHVYTKGKFFEYGEKGMFKVILLDEYLDFFLALPET